jgi:hypothetical protein
MARSASSAAALPTGRFSIARIDGWLDETWLDDARTDEAYLEVRADRTGLFDLGEIQGTFKVTQGRRGRFVGWLFDEGLKGTIQLSARTPDGLVLATLEVRGEEPWLVEAWSPGADAGVGPR